MPHTIIGSYNHLIPQTPSFHQKCFCACRVMCRAQTVGIGAQHRHRHNSIHTLGESEVESERAAGPEPPCPRSAAAAPAAASVRRSSPSLAVLHVTVHGLHAYMSLLFRDIDLLRLPFKFEFGQFPELTVSKLLVVRSTESRESRPTCSCIA